MNRRVFVSQTSAFFAFNLWFKKFESSQDLPAWPIDWVKINDENLPNYEALRVSAALSKYYGGYTNDAEMPNAGSTSGFISRASTLYACKYSKYYLSKALLAKIEEAAKCMLVFQHADGTVDYLDTNFHSTPDLAFILENIIPAYSFIKQTEQAETQNTQKYLKTFLMQAGKALAVGGIHTPNHRWVVSAALSRLNDIFPNKAYTDRIEAWLSEHIDIDADGQYTEKSTNSYSPIVNRSLLMIANSMKKPYLLDFVRKNLEMTLYYVHPNGEVVTEASNRQDKGSISNMIRYYYMYKYMAILDKNAAFGAMCKLIEQTSTQKQLASYLEYFLENNFAQKELPTASVIPTNYVREFPFSGVVRIRRGDWDCTLLAKNASFLTFHKLKTVLQGLRIASSFFGKGQFQTEKIEKVGGNWMLKSSLEAPYYQPLSSDKIDINGDWEKMPKSGRVQSEIQKLTYEVLIKETGNGMEVDFDIHGTDHVPVTLEFIFRAGGVFSGLTPYTKRENAYLFSGEEFKYTVENESITIQNGRVEHKQIALRGALPPEPNPSVYITGFTPFSHKIKVF
jgi:hypothetical protein